MKSATVMGICKISAESENCKRNTHKLVESNYICGIRFHSQNPEQLPLFSCRGLRDKTNVHTKFTLQAFDRGIDGNFANEIPLLFVTRLKTCLWNPGTYRHKILRLSSAQSGLVIKVDLNQSKRILSLRTIIGKSLENV